MLLYGELCGVLARAAVVHPFFDARLWSCSPYSSIKFKFHRPHLHSWTEFTGQVLDSPRTSATHFLMNEVTDPTSPDVEHPSVDRNDQSDDSIRLDQSQWRHDDGDQQGLDEEGIVRCISCDIMLLNSPVSM